MTDPNLTMLRQAILRNAAAVLSLPSAGMLRHHKTRFLGDCPNALGDGTDGLWIEAPVGDVPLLNELMDRQDPVGIAFKGGPTSVVFTAPIRRRLEAFNLNAASEQCTVPALLVEFPKIFKSLQRRAAYRVALPLDNPIALRAWRIAEHAVLRDRPMAAAEVHVRTRDLSVMGVGFTCPSKDQAPPRLTLGERMRVQLKCGDEEVLVEARVIHQRLVGENVLAAGANFKKLEKDFEGRQVLSKLTAIVGRLQREEIQRQRGELAASNS